jgi:hypothetical protein
MTNHSSVINGPFLTYLFRDPEPYAFADCVGSPSDPSNIARLRIRALIYTIFTFMRKGPSHKVARVSGIKLEFS